MEMPKNIMQIGEPDEFYRVYIEDYVYTYIRQLEKEAPGERKKIYLFGKKQNGSEECLLYIYGAADSERGILSVQHEFFPEYDILGILSICRDEKEISLQNGVIFLLKGFFVFYEQNDAMQSFLIRNYQESESQKDKKENVEKRKRLKGSESEIRYTRPDKASSAPLNSQHKKDQNPAGNLLYICAFAMGIVICIIAVTSINQYDKMRQFNSQMMQAVMDQKESEDADEKETVQNDIHIEEMKQTSNMGMDKEETQTQEQPFITEEDIQDISNEPLREYTIQAGDSLIKISRTFYGDESRVEEICLQNHIEDPNDIKQGQIIVLP